MGGGGAQPEVEEDIWNQILSESTSKVSSNSAESRSVVVLGDKHSGKSSLIARLQKEDITEANKGVALSYSFADVYEAENEDPTGRIDFWQLEGEVSHKDLLQFGLNEKTIDSALVVIALDFSQPWTIVESLRRWLAVVETHLNGVFAAIEKGDSPHSKKSLQERVRVMFQTYAEPAAAAAATEAKKKRVRNTQKNVDVAVLPELDGNVLSNNLGVPIAIVCCKSDSTVALEKDFDYNEGMFEYIQQHLRRICLNYGAALIYTSAKKDTNCDALLQYIESVLFGYEFSHKCQLLEKECIFVPAGWDSMPKIKLDFENQKVCKDSEEPYENVIKKPNIIKRREQTTVSILTAEDDQEFLLRHKSKIETDTSKDEAHDKSNISLVDRFKTVSAGIAINTSPEHAHAAPSPSASAPSPAVSESDKAKPTVSAAAAAPKKPSLLSENSKTSLTPPGKEAGSGAAAEKKALTDFFTSLMGAGGGKKPAFAANNTAPDIEKIKQSLKK